jgi:hypothetical protein
MNAKYVAIFTLAAGLLAGSLFVVQAQTEVKPPVPDHRIDKVLDQNEQILKNQDEILKELADIKKGVLQLRVRSG